MHRFEIQEPSAADIAFLEDRLYEFNVRATGIDGGLSLGVFLRDESTRIMAGAAGHTWGETCELRQVWVEPAAQGQGLGRRLLAEAEAEAVRRGCRQLVLTSHSFQAPEFYRKLGFEVIATVPDYPRGHSQVVLRKRLGPSDDSRRVGGYQEGPRGAGAIVLPMETERLLLRDFVDADFDALHAMASDPEVMRFMFHGVRTVQRQRVMLDEVLASQRESPRARYELAVVRRTDGALLGSVDLTPDKPGVADLGYLLRRDAWGRGYATEAARAMLAAGFGQLGLHRIWATCDVNHRASARVLEKVGLRREGVLRGHVFAGERWWDCALYAAVKTDWPATD
jgi:RimJ/RimL family protein N-acetyltransferase/ribosomal protein S18 acetylase RimI-like enzyme